MLFVCIVAVIELIIIIVLSYTLKASHYERFLLTQENSQIHQDIGNRIAAHIEIMIKHANNVRHKVPTMLYTQSIRKNAAVQETCNKFYEELIHALKYK